MAATPHTARVSKTPSAGSSQIDPSTENHTLPWFAPSSKPIPIATNPTGPAIALVTCDRAIDPASARRHSSCGPASIAFDPSDVDGDTDGDTDVDTDVDEAGGSVDGTGFGTLSSVTGADTTGTGSSTCGSRTREAAITASTTTAPAPTSASDRRPPVRTRRSLGRTSTSTGDDAIGDPAVVEPARTSSSNCASNTGRMSRTARSNSASISRSSTLIPDLPPSPTEAFGERVRAANGSPRPSGRAPRRARSPAFRRRPPMRAPTVRCPVAATASIWRGRRRRLAPPLRGARRRSRRGPVLLSTSSRPPIARGR
ncbi:unannotated protein [freshwater metagenome]|uniref:Unannotated protein n=1 Tax=freshwater metagenome TaxID=449393 RepID=A0A6J6F2J5_9ZZZZ